MAGSSKILKPNEILFKTGDAASSMFIVRRGILKVYVEQPGKPGEVELAVLKEGAIVGEMAFFDQKPRSASVKAVTAAELTEISRGDFDRLLTQIPKWFVSMMQSLSQRLRQTNDRLTALQAKAEHNKEKDPNPSSESGYLTGQQRPFQHLTRYLKLMVLALARDGQKDGTGVSMEEAGARSLWGEISGESADLFERFTKSLEQTKLLARRLNDHKQPIFFFPNRGLFVNFADYASAYSAAASFKRGFFKPETLLVLQALLEGQSAGTMDTVVKVPLTSIAASPHLEKVSAEHLGEAARELDGTHGLKLEKRADGIIFAFKPKDLKQQSSNLRHLNIFAVTHLI